MMLLHRPPRVWSLRVSWNPRSGFPLVFVLSDVHHSTHSLASRDRNSGDSKIFLRPGTRVKAAAGVVRGVLVLDRCPSSSPNTSWLPDRRIAGGGLVVEGLVFNLMSP